MVMTRFLSILLLLLAAALGVGAQAIPTALKVAPRVRYRTGLFTFVPSPSPGVVSNILSWTASDTNYNGADIVGTNASFTLTNMPRLDLNCSLQASDGTNVSRPSNIAPYPMPQYGTIIWHSAGILGVTNFVWNDGTNSGPLMLFYRSVLNGNFLAVFTNINISSIGQAFTNWIVAAPTNITPAMLMQRCWPSNYLLNP
jgi:hypothetical protein